MKPIEQVTKIAAQHIWTILPLTDSQNAPFRTLITVKIDGKNIPLLLIGTVQGADEKGAFMAILNPDSYLVEHANSTLALYENIFKKTVATHCDLAIFVWTDKYNKDGVSPRVYQYKALKSKPVDYIIQ